MSILDSITTLATGIARHSGKKLDGQTPPSLTEPKAVNLANTENDKFYVGFASKDITPDNLLTHTYWMAGYSIAKPVKSFLDPLTVNAMWLGTKEREGCVFVSCDLIGLTGYEISIIRKRLSDFCELTGCVNITVSCTHTHAGIDTMGYWGMLPKTGKDKVFMETVISSVVQVCIDAFADRKIGNLYYGSIDAPELINRWREPKFENTLLHRFRFVPDDGSTETWYLNFGAHPNTMGGKNKMLSADYPCYMRREINKVQKTNIMFSVSTIGATDMGHISDNELKRTVLGGEALGRKALEIKDTKKLKPCITLVVKEFVMPIDNPVLAVANYAHIFNSKKCISDSQLGIGFISELNYYEIDGVKILTVPGEMFSELVYPGGYCDEITSATGEPASINPTPLCEILGDNNLIVFGVTNDMAGYALAPNDFVLHETQAFLSRGKDRFGRGHYHETNSCGKSTARIIADACKEIAECINSAK